MARTIKSSRQTIWEWKQNPAFVAWYEQVMMPVSRLHWPLILQRHEQLAMQGSTKSFEILARVRSLGLKGGGFVADPDADGGITNNYLVINHVKQTPQGTVNLLIPRPPALPDIEATT